MLALIIICSIAAYIFVGSTLGNMRKHKLLKECSNCRYGSYCRAEHEGDYITFGVLWPIALLIFGGSATGSFIAERDSRQERKKAREKEKHEMKMKELNAEREIKELEQKTLNAFLKENGINAEVPGLEDALQPR